MKLSSNEHLHMKLTEQGSIEVAKLQSAIVCAAIPRIARPASKIEPIENCPHELRVYTRG